MEAIRLIFDLADDYIGDRVVGWIGGLEEVVIHCVERVNMRSAVTNICERIDGVFREVGGGIWNGAIGGYIACQTSRTGLFVLNLNPENAWAFLPTFIRSIFSRSFEQKTLEQIDVFQDKIWFPIGFSICLSRSLLDLAKLTDRIAASTVKGCTDENFIRRAADSISQLAKYIQGIKLVKLALVHLLAGQASMYFFNEKKFPTIEIARVETVIIGAAVAWKLAFITQEDGTNWRYLAACIVASAFLGIGCRRDNGII